MGKVRILEIKESVFADNGRQADQLRIRLKEKGVFLMNLMSSPGSGKTTTLKRTIAALKDDLRIGVMEADIDSDVDALAIGFGTAHGIYTEKPVLDLNRIALIKSAKDIPYVMHGGSGLSEEEYRTAIHNGIRKINYYTYLSLAGGRGVMQYLEDKKDKDAIYFEDIAKAGITAMKADVKRAMKIFESDGKI